MNYRDEAERRLGHHINLDRNGRLRVEEYDLAVDINVLLAGRNLDVQSGVRIINPLHGQGSESEVVQ